MHKYHYIYKITCNITNKFYIGMHSTNDLQDNYFGSGKILKYSIKKYGKENHSLEILSFYDNRDELSKAEKNIVNEELIKKDLCMNLTTGGDGGYNEQAVKSNKLRKGKKWKEILKSRETLELMKNVAKNNYKNIEKHNFKNLDTEKMKEIAKSGNRARTEKGYIHSKKTKEKIRKSNKNKDWSFRKTKEYRQNISEKTKLAMSKLDQKELQRKALDARTLSANKRLKDRYDKILILKLKELNIYQIADELKVSTRTIYNTINKFEKES